MKAVTTAGVATRRVAGQSQGHRMRALVLLARIIGRKHGIEVVFDPGVATAMTDGKVITLPVISSLGDDDHASLIEGLVDHEAMHCRFTDFDVVKEHHSPILRSLTNLFEDVWGEREQAKIYPGCFVNILKSIEVMIDLGMYAGPSQTQAEPIGVVWQNWLIAALLARHYTNERMGRFAEQYRQLVTDRLGPSLVHKIWLTACEVDHVRSTAEAFSLARKVLDLLQGQSGGEGSANQELAQEILDSCAAPADLGEMILAALGGQGKAGSTADDGSHAVLVSAGCGTVDSGGGTKGGGTWAGECKCPEVQKLTDPTLQVAAIEAARPIEIKLGTKLEGLLESRIEAEVGYRRSGRSVASRRLPGLRVGRTAVFERTEEVDGIDTAIALLVDLSGSMWYDYAGTSRGGVPHSDRRVTSCVAVAYAACQVLDRLSIPFQMAGFGDHFMSIKSFHDAWPRAKQLGMAESLGGTALDKALWRLGEDLLVRDEARRVIVFVTDGEPNSGDSALAVMNELAGCGVEFAPLFVGGEGTGFESRLQHQGWKVARAACPQDLSRAFFEAVECAF